MYSASQIAAGAREFLQMKDCSVAYIIQEDLLHDEGGHCFGEFASHFHCSQAQRNDFGCEQKIYNLCVIHL